MLKLYVLVRNDIDVPFQMCQVTHAVADFATKHPTPFKAWNTGNNTITVLQVPDGRVLQKYIDIAADAGLAYTPFYEPDASSVGHPPRRNESTGEMEFDAILDEDGPWLTAVAFAPDWFLQNVIFTDLKLALDRETVRSKAVKPTEREVRKDETIIQKSVLNILEARERKFLELREMTPKKRRQFFKNSRLMSDVPANKLSDFAIRSGLY